MLCKAVTGAVSLWRFTVSSLWSWALIIPYPTVNKFTGSLKKGPI